MTILHHEEAAQILTRVLEALARASGKTLAARTRADIGRACELLSSAGAELDDLLDDIPAPAPRATPGEYVAADPKYDRWREERRERGER